MCGMMTGVSALVMSFGMPAIGGVNQAAATTLFALLFLFALGKAFRHILRREIASHREWMIRSFSIGLAVATIRPIVASFFGVGVTRDLMRGSGEIPAAAVRISGSRPPIRRRCGALM